MSQIAVVISTSLPQGDMVLRGVYGRLTQTPPAKEGDQPSQVFTVAPELRPVSSIFSYLDNGAAPVKVGEVELIEVADEDIPVVQDQLMYALQKRWRGMYKAMAPSADGLMSALIGGEASKVENAVNSHFASQGKSLWRVPVNGTMTTGQDGAYLQTAAELIKALSPTSCRNIVMTDEPATQHVDSAEDMTAPAATPDPDAPTPDWEDFIGIEAQVQGHIVVVATDENDARNAVRAMLTLSQASTDALKIVPPMVPTAVLATRQLTHTDAVIDADDDTSNPDDDDDDDGDDDDDLRGHYRFG